MKTFEKGIDKSIKICYNLITEREREENKMLVRVWKSFVLKGYTNKEKGVFKKRLVREDIYVSTGITTPIICV